MIESAASTGIVSSLEPRHLAQALAGEAVEDLAASLRQVGAPAAAVGDVEVAGQGAGRRR
jgi:hypothetical protein